MSFDVATFHGSMKRGFVGGGSEDTSTKAPSRLALDDGLEGDDDRGEDGHIEGNDGGISRASVPQVSATTLVSDKMHYAHSRFHRGFY
jgi:hypothetical protein